MNEILGMEVENVKRIKLVRLDLAGKNIAIIGGKNEQGKSSTLDCFEYALGGKPSVEKPIRNGEKKARIVLDTEQYLITREFTEKGSTLKVQAKLADGTLAKVDKGQALLDTLIGNLSFDPMKFIDMDSKLQVETLRKLAGADFSQMDARRAEAFAERTDINRDIKQLEGQLSGMPTHDDAPAEELTVEGLSQEMKAAFDVVQENVEKRTELASLDVKIIGKKNRISDINAKIKELQSQRTEEESELTRLSDRKTSLSAEVSALVDPDIESIKARIAGTEVFNRRVRENAAAKKVSSALEAKREESEALTAEIAAIDEKKSDIIRNANLPVDGLSFDDTGVSFRGIPLKQCSSAERIKISVAIGIALNPKIRLILIRDGSLLDSGNLEIIREMAEKHQALIVVERVSDDGMGCTTYIEDGMEEVAPCLRDGE